MGREAEGEGEGAVVTYREPCKTMGLVPEKKEIKGAVLGRPPYYIVWRPPTAFLSYCIRLFLTLPFLSDAFL